METKIARRVTRLIVPLLIVAALIAVDTPANAGSRSNCPTGYFCVWTRENYEGTRYQYNNVGSYNLISADPIGSAYNHRTKRTYLNQNSGSSSTYSCFGPGDYDGALSNWQIHANSAFLSTYTNC
jgi:hypothetical protein